MKIKVCHIVLLTLGSFIGYKWYQHEQWQQLMVSGYCEKDGTYFDDRYTKQELIDRAINYVLEHQPEGMIGEKGESWDIKRYTSMAEFKKLNPNCCEVQPLFVDFPPEYYDFTLEGKAYRYVILKYKEYYTENRKPENVTEYLAFGNCGDLKTLHELEKMR
ncbi:hypothetical protein NYR70_01565 [Actinobacillus equuli subsp. equuli]|uniref:Uncharacterized protein n=1 Tax=Actinobacillus equuli TaxID=718 RepID=A0AAX3FLI4_ACTEU|nr:hypothetical protein [Actinobacillus equuli]AIZ78489.1 hypothetical protein ACEE_01585 [Actinobacillus equuli subsp. equuli]WGE44758.1 hypothetical protein NYR65_01575 [Actinobacillus equuli subsp. equuli]WGE55390.1 hypothetical protein NYR70_01565 [Actinobacillus equuli subsp. equuli]VEE92432.1 Uncharacterised protein [Actinobacillus equuli]